MALATLPFTNNPVLESYDNFCPIAIEINSITVMIYSGSQDGFPVSMLYLPLIQKKEHRVAIHFFLTLVAISNDIFYDKRFAIFGFQHCVGFGVIDKPHRLRIKIK